MDSRIIHSSFNLFNEGYCVSKVAYALRISDKTAKQLKLIYLQRLDEAEAIYKNGNQEITEYYQDEMRRRSEIIMTRAEILHEVGDVLDCLGISMHDPIPALDPTILKKVRRILGFKPDVLRMIFPIQGGIVTWLNPNL